MSRFDAAARFQRLNMAHPRNPTLVIGDPLFLLHAFERIPMHAFGLIPYGLK
jgi:hypothetical protein